MACVARTASAICVPATNRPETRRPREDRSAKLRKDGFSERWTKNALNMPHLKNGKPLTQIGVSRSQKVVSQGAYAVDRTWITWQAAGFYSRTMAALEREFQFDNFMGFVGRGLPFPRLQSHLGRLNKKRVAAFYFNRLNRAVGLNQHVRPHATLDFHGTGDGGILRRSASDNFPSALRMILSSNSAGREHR